MMTDYYQDPEETKACFTKDGYLLTGDLGYLDKLGFLHLCGRRKDLIIRAGENIAPLAVENALLSLDGIEQACVFAVPSFRLGEKVSCAVVLKKGSSLTVRQIQEALKPLLTKNEIPETIHLLGKLPLLASGKVDKQSLKETYAADGK
jgi:acyl-CoA synthetase (AMP-forming)/AMP-acid ligase II